jgi:hypothetical protein
MASKTVHYCFDDFLPQYQEHHDTTDYVVHSTDLQLNAVKGTYMYMRTIMPTE